MAGCLPRLWNGSIWGPRMRPLPASAGGGNLRFLLPWPHIQVIRRYTLVCDPSLFPELLQHTPQTGRLRPTGVCGITVLEAEVQRPGDRRPPSSETCGAGGGRGGTCLHCSSFWGARCSLACGHLVVAFSLWVPSLRLRTPGYGT